MNFDIKLEKNEFIADSSKTYLVGEVSPSVKRLVQVTFGSVPSIRWTMAFSECATPGAGEFRSCQTST